MFTPHLGRYNKWERFFCLIPWVFFVIVVRDRGMTG